MFRSIKYFSNLPRFIHSAYFEWILIVLLLCIFLFREVLGFEEVLFVKRLILGDWTKCCWEYNVVLFRKFLFQKHRDSFYCSMSFICRIIYWFSLVIIFLLFIFVFINSIFIDLLNSFFISNDGILIIFLSLST